MKPVEPKDHWLHYWESYLKKIPKAGLNNTKSLPQWFQDKYGPVKPKSTLPERLEKIIAIGPFAQAPPFFHYAGSMITHGTEKENLPKIKELTKQIIDRLEELYDNMDGVHVLTIEELAYWKRKIKETILYIKKQSKWIGMVQETEFKIIGEERK